MRSRIDVAVCSAALAIALTNVPARAADCAGIVSPCINDDTLWPHAGPARFVGVGSAESMARGKLGFGLVTTYLSRPIVLHLASPGVSVGGTEHDAVNDQVNGTFLWSYGVTHRLELDIALPLTFGQGGTGLAPVTGGQGLRDTAVRDLRFGFAYAILPHALEDTVGGLVGRFEVSAPTGDSDQFAGEHSAVFVPSIAGDYRLGRLYAGAEVGARIRPTTELLGAAIGTQLVVALGVGCRIVSRDLLAVGLEAWALPTLADQGTVTAAGDAYTAQPNGGHIAPAEWQLSVHSAPLRSGDLFVELGGGGGIPWGGDLPITTPRFRFTLGLRWAPRYR
jgi:OOP family OmpA-OmpF porin